MWTPNTEADLELVISERVLAESHKLDAKESTGDTESARRSTAQDLASFAIDGGALIIGISEDKHAAEFSLSPVNLVGLVEKIEQIAANAVDPPVHIHVTEIASRDKPGLGYLYVEIPPSPHAPHMVKGVYFGRADRTTRRLTDAEVARLHALRHTTEERVLSELRSLVSSDPVSTAAREKSHFYFLAEPKNSVSDAAQEFVRHRSNTSVQQLLVRSETYLTPEFRAWAPRPTDARHSKRRSRGSAFSTMARNHWNSKEDHEDSFVEIEIRENAGIRAILGRGRDFLWDSDYLLDALVVSYTLRLVHWAREVSDEIGYRGSWDFAVAGDLLRGASALGWPDQTETRPRRRDWLPEDRYDADTYQETTSAHYSELVDAPGKVANRLVGALLRGFGTDHFYRFHLEQPESPSP